MSSFKMPSVLAMVAEFHVSFGHPVVDKPTLAPEERGNLRVALLEEEVKEFNAARLQDNLVEVLDALCDTQYVLGGAILEYGLGDIFEEAFKEVQRSNMSKACSTREEAVKTVNHYATEKNTPCYFRQVGERFLIYRSEDDKTLKSIYYSPANLAPIIAKALKTV